MENFEFARFLHIRAAHAPTFAPDGSRIAFLTNITGFSQVWSLPSRGGWPEQLTFGPGRIRGIEFSPTDPHILYAIDAGGNEHDQLYLLEGDGRAIRPLAQDLNAIHSFGGWSADGKRAAWCSNRRDRAIFDAYVQDVATGETRLVYRGSGISHCYGFSPDDRSILVTAIHNNSDNDLYLVPVDGFEASGPHRSPVRTGEAGLAPTGGGDVPAGGGDVPAGGHDVPAARLLTPHEGSVLYQSAVFHPDGRHLILVTDRDGDFMQIRLLDLETLAFSEFVPLPDPAMRRWDVEHLALARSGRFVVIGVNVEGATELFAYDREKAVYHHASGLPLSEKEFSRDAIHPTEGRMAVTLAGPDRATSIWSWDFETGETFELAKSAHAGLPRTLFAVPELVRFPSFDDLSIPAWVYRPREGDGPFPAVVYVHGGPEAQTSVAFNGVIQYMVHRGYVVLAPNVRGSTGYGKEYKHLDDVEKRMDSVADLAACVHWLRDSGLAHPDRIAVMGGSYGGFMVLAGLTTYPELFAAGVDIVGVANFVTFLENTGPWRRKNREAEYGSLEHHRAFLESISPIHGVHRIRAPLCVIHGANDPRVPVSEAEQIVESVQARGIPVLYLRYENEGHGLARLENRLDAYPKVLDFLETHLLRDDVPVTGEVDRCPACGTSPCDCSTALAARAPF